MTLRDTRRIHKEIVRSLYIRSPQVRRRFDYVSVPEAPHEVPASAIWASPSAYALDVGLTSDQTRKSRLHNSVDIGSYENGAPW